MKVRVVTILGEEFWADSNDERAVMLAPDGDCITEDGHPVAMLQYENGLTVILDTDDGRAIIGYQKPPAVLKAKPRRRRID